MSDYTVISADDVDDYYADTDVPGEFRPLTRALRAECRTRHRVGATASVAGAGGGVSRRDARTSGTISLAAVADNGG